MHTILFIALSFIFKFIHIVILMALIKSSINTYLSQTCLRQEPRHRTLWELLHLDIQYTSTIKQESKPSLPSTSYLYFSIIILLSSRGNIFASNRKRSIFICNSKNDGGRNKNFNRRLLTTHFKN